MKLKYLLTVLRTMKMPGLFPIMKDWQSLVRMHFIYSSLESGLLEALLTPSTREELIRKLGVKRPSVLDAILDVGVTVKELAYENGSYSIKGKRSKAVITDDGDILAAMIQANVTYYNSSYRNAAERMYGAPLGDDLKKIGALVARFSKIGEPFIRHFITDIISGIDSPRVLDVGCGSGVFLKSIYEANPKASGIGMDIDEEVVEQANKNLIKWGQSDKFGIVAGDICAPPDALEGPFDLILLYNIIYYFSLEQRLDLLSKLRSMLATNGSVSIAMHFQSMGKDLGAANLNMVNCSFEGLTPLPALDELTEQLKQSGFRDVKISRLIPGSTFFGITAGIAETAH